jgi:hypothetical protein
MTLSAHEVSRLVHNMGRLEEFAVKTAEEKDAALIGASNARAASDLYAVMAKEAAFMPDGSNPFRMCRTVSKLAHELEKTAPGAITQLKLAAAVAVDDTFDRVLASGINGASKTKIAELQAYGREYVVELLRGVI